MTYKQKYDSCKTWQEKCLIINLYHCLMVLEHDDWQMRQTAKYFNISLGLVSEDIKLAIHIELVKSCKYRKDALELVK